MYFKKDHSPKEDFEKALVVLNKVKNIMMKEYKEKRIIIERIIKERIQK